MQGKVANTRTYNFFFFLKNTQKERTKKRVKKEQLITNKKNRKNLKTDARNASIPHGSRAIRYIHLSPNSRANFEFFFMTNRTKASEQTRSKVTRIFLRNLLSGGAINRLSGVLGEPPIRGKTTQHGGRTRRVINCRQ